MLGEARFISEWAFNSLSALLRLLVLGCCWTMQQPKLKNYCWRAAKSGLKLRTSEPLVAVRKRNNALAVVVQDADGLARSVRNIDTGPGRMEFDQSKLWVEGESNQNEYVRDRARTFCNDVFSNRAILPESCDLIGGRKRSLVSSLNQIGFWFTFAVIVTFPRTTIADCDLFLKYMFIVSCTQVGMEYAREVNNPDPSDSS